MSADPIFPSRDDWYLIPEYDRVYACTDEEDCGCRDCAPDEWDWEGPFDTEREREEARYG